MRALGWLGLLGAVAVLAYTALCLSAPFKAEAHHIEWLTPEEAVMVDWALSSWSPQQWLPAGTVSDRGLESVTVMGDSVHCPLTTSGGGVGSRWLWLDQGPEGPKLQEHLSWSVPFYLRGWERLQGEASKARPIGRTMKAQVVSQALQSAVELTWNGGAFVAVSSPFVIDPINLQEPDSLGGDSVPLWCWSIAASEGRKWQWMQQVEPLHLDSVLAAGGLGWSATADTLPIWEALPNASTSLVLLDLLQGENSPQDSLAPVWAMRWSQGRPQLQSKTAPQSKTTTLFQFKRAKISGR